MIVRLKTKFVNRLLGIFLCFVILPDFWMRNLYFSDKRSKGSPCCPLDKPRGNPYNKKQR